MKEVNDKIARRLFEVFSIKNSFNGTCFEVLNHSSESVDSLSQTFTQFIQIVLASNGINKQKALVDIFSSVRVSELLLDSMITAFYSTNFESQSRSSFHNWINEKFSKLEWSSLNRLSFIDFEPPPINGVYSPFLYLVLFQQSSYTDIIRTKYIDIEILSFFPFLNAKGRDNLSDSLCCINRDNPVGLLSCLISIPDLFLPTFRNRDDYQLLQSALRISDPQVNPKYVSLIKSLHSYIDENTIFSFFKNAVIPYADLFENKFLAKIISNPCFPYNRKDFPFEQYISNEKLLSVMNVTLFFSFLASGTCRNLPEKYFSGLVETFDAGAILNEFFLLSQELAETNGTLFSYFLCHSPTINASIFFEKIKNHIYYNEKCVFYYISYALENSSRLDIIVSQDLLRLIFEISYSYPSLALPILSQISANPDYFQMFLDLWNQEFLLNMILDEIENKKKNMKFFENFLYSVINQGNKALVSSIVDSLEDGNKYKPYCIKILSRSDSYVC